MVLSLNTRRRCESPLTPYRLWLTRIRLKHSIRTPQWSHYGSVIKTDKLLVKESREIIGFFFDIHTKQRPTYTLCAECRTCVILNLMMLILTTRFKLGSLYHTAVFPDFFCSWTPPMASKNNHGSSYLVHINTVPGWFFLFSWHDSPRGPGPPHYQGFTITLRHTTLGTTPLDE